MGIRKIKLSETQVQSIFKELLLFQRLTGIIILK